MADELKVYEGAEREQLFVKRYERNPTLGQVTARGNEDKRRYRTTAKWMYCVTRHRDYWRARKPKRPHSIPDYTFEGEEGWWFPKLWVVEYEQMKPSKVMILKQREGV